MKAAAIILSGGKSSRMGTNKALLKINDKTNIERISDSLRPHFDDIILVTNDPEQYRFLGLKMVEDHYPGMGPLAGIHAGIKASDYETNVTIACDMPFVSGEIAKSLVNKSNDYDAVVPIINGRLQTLFAVFKKNVTAHIEKCIEDEQLRIKDLLDHLNVRYVTEKDLQAETNIDLERVFFNMNHPNEYEDAKKWAKVDQERM
jgi:molybdopterin-guanine dinucleotide biosynthesis protein A